MSISRPYSDDSLNKIYQSLIRNTLAQPTFLAATNLMRCLADTPLTQTR
jgi:hypothetical protein